MKRGVPPTARNARTGEFTPPGVTRRPRSNRASEAGAAGGYAVMSAILSSAPAVGDGCQGRAQSAMPPELAPELPPRSNRASEAGAAGGYAVMSAILSSAPAVGDGCQGRAQSAMPPEMSP